VELADAPSGTQAALMPLDERRKVRLGLLNVWLLIYASFGAIVGVSDFQCRQRRLYQWPVKIRDYLLLYFIQKANRLFRHDPNALENWKVVLRENALLPSDNGTVFRYQCLF
jgi:hypothetical protein